MGLRPKPPAFGRARSARERRIAKRRNFRCVQPVRRSRTWGAVAALGSEGHGRQIAPRGAEIDEDPFPSRREPLYGVPVTHRSFSATANVDGWPRPRRAAGGRPGLVTLFAALLVLVGCQEKRAERCKLECKENGRCTGASDDRCIATEVDDCKRSRGCTEKGTCALGENECVVGAEGCRGSAECRATGACSVAGAACAAVTREDCAGIDSCKRDGRCTPQNGRCVATAEDCAKTRACIQLGKCTPLDEMCSTLSSGDCARAEICTEQGYCTFRNGSCVLASDEDCKKTRACRVDGLCYFDDVRANKGLPQGACVKKPSRGR
jgi:hypothetical protein